MTPAVELLLDGAPVDSGKAMASAETAANPRWPTLRMLKLLLVHRQVQA